MKKKRLLVAAVSVALLGVAGIAYARRGVSDSSLLEAGRQAVAQVSKEVDLRNFDPGKAAPISREEVRPGIIALTYELPIERKIPMTPQTANLHIGTVSGTFAAPLVVEVREELAPDALGFTRPVWVRHRVAFTRTPKVAEEMWARLNTEPSNVLFDNAILKQTVDDGSFHVLQLAAFLRIGEHADAARLVDNSSLWTDEIAWTSRWAQRLQSEMERFEKDVDSGRVAVADEDRARRSIYHFAHNPKLANFRQLYKEMLQQSPHP